MEPLYLIVVIRTYYVYMSNTIMNGHIYIYRLIHNIHNSVSI